MNTQTVNKISDIIKKILLDHKIDIKRMILFGSRARGDSRVDSDYDFIVITARQILPQEKMEMWLSVSRALAEINVTSDILFKSESEFELDKFDTGKVTYYANKEGITI